MTVTPQPPTNADPFASPGGVWHPISPALVGIRRLTSLVWLLVLVVPLLALCVVAFIEDKLPWLPWVLLGAAVMLAIWPLWRLVRARAWVAAWGWCERDEDFCVRSGLLNRRVTVVPVGRMQVVKVSAGPLLRKHGLARLEFITATPETEAHVPALPADVAAELRDRLIAKSDAKDSGL